MSSWTTGGWSGNVGRLDNPVQQIAERNQVRDGNYNTGAYHGFGINRPVPKQSRGIWAYMCKSQRCEIAHDGNVKLSIAKNFRGVLWVCYKGLLRLIGHR